MSYSSYPYDGNYPNADNSPPPQYTPPPAPGSSHHYTPHPDVSRFAHPQSQGTYNNSQAMIQSPYGYPANSNHGHYASAPRPDQTLHDVRAPETGPHRAYHDPRLSDPGPYGSYGNPNASNRGPYPSRAYGNPHAANTLAGSYAYEVPGGAHAPNAGSYQTYHVPHVSETRPYDQRQSFPSSSPPTNNTYFSPSDVGSQPPGYDHNWPGPPPSSPSSQPSPAYRAPEYSSSQVPEKHRHHSSSDAWRGGDTLAAETSTARARGSDARADTSNAIPVSNFQMTQTVRAQITADTWVMGVIIGVAHLCSKVTGRAYWVEFQSVEGRKREMFSEERLRPYTPGS